MLDQGIREQLRKSDIGNAVANTLRCLYSDENLDKYWKEAILGVFCKCFKDYCRNFDEKGFKNFVRGK